MDWVYDGMKSMPKVELYDREGTWAKSDLLSEINSNSNDWLNHLGHGNRTWNMKLGNSDIASMTNTKGFFLYTQACYSGSIDGRTWGNDYITGGDCILEDMVNASTNGALL